MKKYIFYLCLCIAFSSFLLKGCTLEEYTTSTKKPKELYYTENLINDMKNSKFSVRILETSFYKEVILKEENLNLITDLTNELKNGQIIEEASLTEDYLPEKSLYKMYIDIEKKRKYIIEIYGDDLIAIYPWDGYYKKDILKLNNIPASLKPENLCKYILKL